MREFDYIIIGGGCAGLSLAYELETNRKLRVRYIMKERTSSIKRKTNETDIELELNIDGIGKCLCRGLVGLPCAPRIVGGAAVLRLMFLSRSRRWKVVETIGGKCRSAIQRGSLVKHAVGGLFQGAIERNGRL